MLQDEVWYRVLAARPGIVFENRFNGGKKINRIADK